MYWLTPMSHWTVALPYWYHYQPSGLGNVSTTQKNTTLYSSPSSAVASSYFQKFNQDALNSYYSGDDVDFAKKMRLANLALQNVTDESSIPLSAQFNDTLDKTNLPTIPDLLSPFPSFFPPPPPF